MSLFGITFMQLPQARPTRSEGALAAIRTSSPGHEIFLGSLVFAPTPAHWGAPRHSGVGTAARRIASGCSDWRQALEGESAAGHLGKEVLHLFEPGYRRHPELHQRGHYHNEAMAPSAG